MKKITTLILALALSATLVGCDKNENDYNENNTPNSTQGNESNVSNNNSNVNNNSNNTANNNDNYNDANGNFSSESEGLATPETDGINVKYESGDIMTIEMFGLYKIHYKFEGEKVVENYVEYTFTSEAAAKTFFEEYTDDEISESEISGDMVLIKYKESEFENLTKTDVVDLYENLKYYYENGSGE